MMNLVEFNTENGNLLGMSLCMDLMVLFLPCCG